ncbi:MAG: hypothetical protein N3D85_01655 [Candidatus Bathyarchaeota archaeon]|nr:hypothetical protein [Candidatus Bathyarchaeota archaeon]
MHFKAVSSSVVIWTLILLFTSNNYVQGQVYTQYTVDVFEDCSATWIITQVLDINGTVDTWDGFQQKVSNLVNAAMNQTQREMNVVPASLQMDTALSWETQSKTVKYIFTWANFSYAQNGQVIVGDVFGVNGFFSLLYGDGTLQINYPQKLAIQSVVPAPSERDDKAQTIKWLGSQYFINGHPHIVLADTNVVSNSDAPTAMLIIGVVGTLLAFSLGSLGFVLAKRRMQQIKETNINKLPEIPKVETEEEKILKTLKSAGGSMFQWEITEKCRFSKAKTSQLLAVLEKKGIVRRYKKGRDKIVMLIENPKGEQQ